MLLVVATVSVLYALQPSSYRLSRVRTIAAPAASIRPCLVDLKMMEGWQVHFADPHSPPTVTFSAVTSGVGAWVERKDLSSTARTTMTEVTDDAVRLAHVNEGRLGTGKSTIEYLLREHGTSTDVEFAIFSPLSGLPRLLWPIADLEKRVGPDMVKGLEQLETKCVNAAR